MRICNLNGLRATDEDRGVRVEAEELTDDALVRDAHADPVLLAGIPDEHEPFEALDLGRGVAAGEAGHDGLIPPVYFQGRSLVSTCNAVGRYKLYTGLQLNFFI